MPLFSTDPAALCNHDPSLICCSTSLPPSPRSFVPHVLELRVLKRVRRIWFRSFASPPPAARLLDFGPSHSLRSLRSLLPARSARSAHFSPLAPLTSPPARSAHFSPLAPLTSRSAHFSPLDHPSCHSLAPPHYSLRSPHPTLPLFSSSPVPRAQRLHHPRHAPRVRQRRVRAPHGLQQA